MQIFGIFPQKYLQISFFFCNFVAGLCTYAKTAHAGRTTSTCTTHVGKAKNDLHHVS